MAGYATEQEYYQELLDITKEKLDLYCRTAVSVDEDGALQRIRGKLLFKRELERLCVEPFSGEEIRAYREEMDEILGREKRLQEKALEYMGGGNMLAFEYVCRMFGLGALERHLLSMALAPEMDAQFERVFCLLQDDYSLKMPTLDLCIQVLTLDPQERLELQQSIVERFGVLGEFFDGIQEALSEQGKVKSSLLSTPLKLNGRILLFLRDITGMDEGLKDFVELSMPGSQMEPFYIREENVQALSRLVEQTEGRRFLFLSGSRDIGKKFLARHFCRETGRPLLLVNTERLLGQEEAADRVRDLIRESYLKGNAWICFADVPFPEEASEPAREFEELLWLLRDYQGIPIFTSRARWSGAAETRGSRCLEFHMPAADSREREILWSSFLGESEWPGDVTPAQIAGKYMLPPGGIRRSVEEARQKAIVEGRESLTAGLLFESCQRQLVHKLGNDALRVHSPYRWEDLILPESQKGLLMDACHQVEYQNQIYRDWGFQRKVAYGRGVSMIFYGPPGTGKTMGAQVMANQLNLELYKVNMAGVMSRYVGDSEKKLDQIFEQGKRSQSILFFDEADVLFGKRSETKDAQDKYANASTAYLLQKVEEYEGILILATNFLQNFDNAFRRRFKFIIEFPFPDPESRRSIWAQVFPDAVELEEPIDVDWLAEEYKLSGSQIKNIALAASFLAAGERTGLAMRHVLTALKREQLKDGKQMIASDFGKYYYLME
ncbi:MAG: ATP-binding protein [Eubacteriales bacterium]|nr:ATP-binding protein [Eubacteriales bacterium]